jgi:hypothetical protein
MKTRSGIPLCSFGVIRQNGECGYFCTGVASHPEYHGAAAMNRAKHCTNGCKEAGAKLQWENFTAVKHLSLTAVFDYGPLNGSTKGFQVVYSSRQSNSAGDVKELYHSNSGTLDLDKNMITGDGGLEENYAKAMGMKVNRLSTRALIEKSAGVENGAHAGVDEATSGNVRNWNVFAAARLRMRTSKPGTAMPSRCA